MSTTTTTTATQQPDAHVWARYWRRFGEVPAMHSHGTNEDLDRLMEAALARGRALSLRQICAAQRLRMPPTTPTSDVR